ncbi:hypothetical protein JXA56_03290 [Candidatus Micrarchaeota archaeon]|nr:hypothetical protein [Candidatus Micrarchaeota archaeon]
MTTAVAEKKPERIRGPNLAVLVRRSGKVRFENGLRRADEQGLVIASNKRLNILVRSHEWRNIEDGLPCWTGTMTGYEEPGKKFGKTIEYVDPETDHRWVFPVPENYWGEANAILVAEHPDYNLEVDGRNRVVHSSQIDLVKAFPTELKGWYKGDPKHDIPQGDQASRDNEDARYLFRIEKRVGPVVRYFNTDHYYGRNVHFDERPSDYSFGVVVESTERGRPQKLQVQTGESGVLVKGVTMEEFNELVGNADANLQEIAGMLKPEKLDALTRLLQSLKE